MALPVAARPDTSRSPARGVESLVRAARLIHPFPTLLNVVATAGLASVTFALPPGTLIVLDSGRWLHRLTPVQGSRTRWSACSFIACSRDERRQLAWG